MRRFCKANMSWLENLGKTNCQEIVNRQFYVSHSMGKFPGKEWRERFERWSGGTLFEHQLVLLFRATNYSKCDSSEMETEEDKLFVRSLFVWWHCVIRFLRSEFFAFGMFVASRGSNRKYRAFEKECLWEFEWRNFILRWSWTSSNELWRGKCLYWIKLLDGFFCELFAYFVRKSTTKVSI